MYRIDFKGLKNPAKEVSGRLTFKRVRGGGREEGKFVRIINEIRLAKAYFSEVSKIVRESMEGNMHQSGAGKYFDEYIRFYSMHIISYGSQKGFILKSRF